jgi:integrase
LARNPAELVKPLPTAHKDVDTYSVAEVDQLRASFADDRLAHAYELALVGLRRGELAGLRWRDVDFQEKTIAITNNRVSTGGRVVENDPKTMASRRLLPLPERIVGALRAAHRRQAAEKLALGADSGPFDYVVANEAVAPAVIAARIGHTDASFTMKLYTHSQPDALKAAGGTFDRVGTTSAH